MFFLILLLCVRPVICSWNTTSLHELLFLPLHVVHFQAFFLWSKCYRLFHTHTSWRPPNALPPTTSQLTHNIQHPPTLIALTADALATAVVDHTYLLLRKLVITLLGVTTPLVTTRCMTSLSNLLTTLMIAQVGLHTLQTRILSTRMSRCLACFLTYLSKWVSKLQSYTIST